MSALPFPSVPSEMSAGWLSATLGSEIGDFAIEPVSAGAGFAGSVYRIHLASDSSDGSQHIPATVIWKTASTHPPTHRLLMRVGAYQAEVLFYSTLARRVPVAPRTYFSEYDAESGALSILQTDLAWMEAGDQIEGCTLAQARAVVSALAELHATFWSDDGCGDLENVPRFDGGADVASRMHSVSWLRMKQSETAIPPGLAEAAERIAPHVAAIKRRLAAPPVTMLHGDVRSDNMFFDPAAGSGGVKLIDWQAIRAGRGAYDLAYFLATSLPIELRRLHQSTLVESYVDALASRGVAGYNMEVCAEDLRWSLLDVVTFVGIIGAALDFGSGRGLQLTDAVMTRLWASAADNRALELLG